MRDDAALLPDAQGNIRWHGVMLDITDRKLAEEELERRAEQQAAVARLGKQALEGEDVSKLMRAALEEATQDHRRRDRSRVRAGARLREPAAARQRRPDEAAVAHAPAAHLG